MCSVAQAESNLPCEDRYCIRAKSGIVLFAVFDGHGGKDACDIACGQLLDHILEKLVGLNISSTVDPSLVTQIIQMAFQNCDNVIIAAEKLKQKRNPVSLFLILYGNINVILCYA